MPESLSRIGTWLDGLGFRRVSIKLATDVYINTDAKALPFLAQGTILHEALHNLTGMYDDGLEMLLGLNPPRDCPTSFCFCITKKLEDVNCAGTN